MADLEVAESAKPTPRAVQQRLVGASPPASASSAEIKPTDKPLRELFHSLSTGQAWSIGAACVAVICGSFLLGGVLQSGRDDTAINAKDQQITSLKSESATNKLASDQQIASLNTRVRDQDRAITEVTKNLTGALNEKDIYAQKAEFLNRYLSYVQGHDSVAKTLLVNVVCLMWKESEKKRVSILRGPPNITAEQIRSGLDSETEALLFSNNIPRDLIDRIRTPERFVQSSSSTSRVNVLRQAQVFPGQDAQEVRQIAGATVEKYVSTIRIIKIITFPDGSQYQMPDEIALAVHTKPECAPT
jgi:hypothetical protein